MADARAAAPTGAVPGREDWVRCRGCGWEGSEADTIWTDAAGEECDGHTRGAMLSCQHCLSPDLADHPDSLAYPDEYRDQVSQADFDTWWRELRAIAGEDPACDCVGDDQESFRETWEIGVTPEDAYASAWEDARR